LQDKQNRRLINCDEKLQAVTGKAQVDMLELTKFVSEHLELKGGEAAERA
jgi:chromatin remodeling complex protein RSC6